MFKPKVRYVARLPYYSGEQWCIRHAKAQDENAISGVLYTRASAKRIAAALNLYEAYRHGECDIKGVDVYNTVAS